MITRGSKFFLGAAVVGFLTAVVYGMLTGASAHGGITNVFVEGAVVDSIVGPLTFGWKGWVGDQVGYSILMGFSGTMAVLAGFTLVFRDGDAEAVLGASGVDVPAGGSTAQIQQLRVVTPTALSYWPLLAAFGVGLVIVGLSFSSVLFVIGVILLIVAGVEWTVTAWSESATGDPEENRQVRNRFMHPIEIPVGATLAAALIVFCFSRVLLAVSKLTAVYLVILVAAGVFAVALAIASRPQIKRSLLVGALLAFGVAIIAGGIIGGIVGPNDREHHGTEEESFPAPRSGAPEQLIGLDGPTAEY